MSNKQILEKAIQKAIDGGWKHHSIVDDRSEAEIFVYADSSMINFGYHLNNRIYYIGGNAEPTNNIIFNHDFTKALWGKEPIRMFDQYEPKEECGQVNLENWEYHLQNMVISDDPIEYLGDNIPE